MKTLSRVLTALQILLLFGGAALHYLCQQRMGVARHIVYLTRKWQSALNLDTLFFTLIALFLICACLLILWQRKHSQAVKQHLPLLALGVATLVFMLVFHGSGLRTYYQLLAIFDAVLLLQLLKSTRHSHGVLFRGRR